MIGKRAIVFVGFGGVPPLRGLPTGVLVLLALLCFRCDTSASSAERGQARNVILILTDDQGAHLSALGTPGLLTPHMDALAARGVYFSNAFAAVPSCSPSRSAINTGMYPHANGHWRNTMGPKLSDPPEAFGRAAKRVDKVGVHEYVPTLPELLGAAGYFTAITQKFHMSPPWKFPYDARDPVHNDPAAYREQIGAFIDAAGAQPFFFQANISPPHRPFRHHLDDFPQYAVDPATVKVPGDLPDTPQARADWAEYLGCVQLADACVGAIMAELEARGIAKETLIIFTGDQGQAYQRAKASAYYAGMHVPLVVAGPQVRGMRKSEELVSLLDLMPTVLEYVGVPVPATVQGQSLWDLLGEADGEEADEGDRTYVFGEYNSHGPARSEHYPTRMVFDGRYYYLLNLMPDKDYRLPDDLRNAAKWGNHAYAATVSAEKEFPEPYRLLRMLESGRPPVELYDMNNDPYQTTNLAGRPELAAREAQLARALADWRERTGDKHDDPLEILTRQTTPP